MNILWGRLTAWISSSVLTFWTAHKLLLVTTFLAFLGIILYNLLVEITQEVMIAVMNNIENAAADIDNPTSVSVVYSFLGLTGWILDCFKLPQCLTLIVDVVLLKFTLRKIPFIKW